MSSSSQVPESWISAFCSLVGHEYFAEVSEDFIEDDFNLTGLQSQVPMYKEALEMILDVEPEDASEEEEEEEEEEDEDEDEDEMHGDGLGRGYRRADAAAERRHLRMASDLSVIESSAEMLYGLIHQRFITSRPGIQQMAEKYDLGHFGHCPRVFCHGAKVLPVGCSDIPGQETVKLFCPSCLDVYSPPNSRFQTVDGAFFGTTFGCLFFMTFPDLEVGGQRPSFLPDPSASSANQAHNLDKTARSSLSSSLTSQQPGVAPPGVENMAPHHDPGNANNNNLSWSGPPWPPKQPSNINGVSPKNLAPGLGPGNIYEPRIYGFRVSEFAKTGPRMKWLRSRPQDVNELNECGIWEHTQKKIALRNQANAQAATAAHAGASSGGGGAAGAGGGGGADASHTPQTSSSTAPSQQQQQQLTSVAAPTATTTEVVDSEMIDEEEDEAEEGEAVVVAEDAEMIIEGSAGPGIDVPGPAAAQKRKAAAAGERGKQRMHTDPVTSVGGGGGAGTNGGTSLVNGDSRGSAVRVGDGG